MGAMWSISKVTKSYGSIIFSFILSNIATIEVNLHSLYVLPYDVSDSAGLYFEQSLSAYKHCAGPQDPAFLTAQDDFCRFLLLSDQQEVTHNHTHTYNYTSMFKEPHNGY